jgi:hypothetical protein
MKNSDLLYSGAIISAWLATQHLSNTNIYRLMAASLIKALTGWYIVRFITSKSLFKSLEHNYI